MKRTILFDEHVELGAKIGDFGEYSMPLWYNSPKEEHLSVLNGVGIFDTSHMCVLSVSGNDAFSLLQRTFTRDISRVNSGRSLYGLFLDKRGWVIDDALVYIVKKDSFLIVVNSGMADPIIDHLNSQGFKNYKIVNYQDRLGKIDIQGPNSLALIESIFGSDLFNDFPYFSFKGSFIDSDIRFLSEPLLISRSGYTGEFGFELFIDADSARELWLTLLEKGKSLNIKPCGLAARDSLRVGAGLPLSHQDIGSWIFGNTPWDFAVDADKSDFIGCEMIKNPESFTYAFVGLNPRKVKRGSRVLLDGEEVGEVLTCITEISLADGKGVAAGFIRANRELPLSTTLILRDGKKDIEITTVKNIRDKRTARKSIDYIRRLK